VFRKTTSNQERSSEAFTTGPIHAYKNRIYAFKNICPKFTTIKGQQFSE
jgi:hypothetical protein